MEKTFEQIRREPFLLEPYYKELVEFIEGELADPEDLETIADSSIEQGGRRGLSWWRAYNSLELLIARYSGGDSVESLVPYAKRMVAEFQRHWDTFPDEDLNLWEPDAYQYVLWLIALLVMLGQERSIPQVATWISDDPEDGQDVLVSRLFARFGVAVPGDELFHEKPYANLLRATETQGKEQQKAMATYLKRWYGGMKGCYWHDMHKARPDSGFFGYWSFEAGLVTLLWDIDDSAYRDMPFYPKDLVDYAREHKTVTGKTEAPHIARRTGEACPHTGRWAVLESPSSFVQERHFREGELFPQGIGRDGNEGPVTWIVLSREDKGPTREE